MSLLLSGGNRGLRRLHRIPPWTIPVRFFIVKQKGGQGLSHMPLDIIRQHPEKKTGPNMILCMMPNGTNS